MNKATKGAIAAAAGAIILAGGAGTMAAWNASTGSASSTAVTAGSLNITEQAGGTWSWSNGDAFNPATDKLVPGDSVKYTATYNVALVGKNLKATLTPTLGGVSGDLAPYLTTTSAGDTGAGVEVVAPGGTKTITTTVLFDPAKVTDNASQSKGGSLNGAAVTLTQKL